MAYEIMREIGIDAGHRIPTHGSKCRNLHGHRYKIQLHCSPANATGRSEQKLIGSGEQTSMVMDFGFMKQAMMKIDCIFDHKMILWIGDPALGRLIPDPTSMTEIKARIQHKPFTFVSDHHTVPALGPLVVTNFIPTAEELAECWFNLVKPEIEELSKSHAEAVALKVWETPNCNATYIPFRDSADG